MSHKEKEDESELPELPPIKFNPDKPMIYEDDEELERHSLPSFPDSPIDKGFSQTAIKEAIKDSDDSKEQDKSNIKTIEMKEWKSEEGKKIPKLPKLSEKLGVEYEPQMISPEKKKEVFVKIAKFRSAKKSMEEISNSLDEVESLMKRIRETKMREEQEFSSWEKEVESVKSRIESIRQNIFERI